MSARGGMSPTDAPLPPSQTKVHHEPDGYEDAERWCSECDEPWPCPLRLQQRGTLRWLMNSVHGGLFKPADPWPADAGDAWTVWRCNGTRWEIWITYGPDGVAVRVAGPDGWLYAATGDADDMWLTRNLP